MALASGNPRSNRVALAVARIALAGPATAYLLQVPVRREQLDSANIEPRADYRKVAEAPAPLVEHELKEKAFPLSPLRS